VRVEVLMDEMCLPYLAVADFSIPSVARGFRAMADCMLLEVRSILFRDRGRMGNGHSNKIQIPWRREFLWVATKFRGGRGLLRRIPWKPAVSLKANIDSEQFDAERQPRPRNFQQAGTIKQGSSATHSTPRNPVASSSNSCRSAPIFSLL